MHELYLPFTATNYELRIISFSYVTWHTGLAQVWKDNSPPIQLSVSLLDQSVDLNKFMPNVP